MEGALVAGESFTCGVLHRRAAASWSASTTRADSIAGQPKLSVESLKAVCPCSFRFQGAAGLCCYRLLLRLVMIRSPLIPLDRPPARLRRCRSDPLCVSLVQ
uniref:Uncharacterized protein n=1 Tax=Zea mays TaxID=4577 RepID=B6U3G0_MAIZE|nr:hypothetical protein [Zea mays]|eukprot:NP_001159057.1 uncharacterized protein LOC100304091 [Zea mays]